MKKRKIKRLGSIAAEKATCIRAFKKYPRAEYAWCLHHEILYEKIIENWDVIGRNGWRGRVEYILKKKYSRERARRFRNFRPVKPGTRVFSVETLTKQWPNHTWNGSSIFPDNR